MTSTEPSIRFIVRIDNMGMTHASNIAVARSLEEGILTYASIQAIAPWAEEACAHPNERLDLDRHLCTLDEWQSHRWRLVLPYSAMTSLINERRGLKLLGYRNLETER